MTPTPTQIESFKKGLELGLVPSGWELSHPGNTWFRNEDMRSVYSQKPTALDIEAMEGIAGRVLIQYCCNLKLYDEWCLYKNGGYICALPGTHDDTLTPLVEAVGRLGK